MKVRIRRFALLGELDWVKARTLCLSLLVLLHAGAAICDGLSLTIVPAKPRMVVGEPLFVAVEIANRRATLVRLSLGVDGVKSFAVKVRDNKGIVVSLSLPRVDDTVELVRCPELEIEPGAVGRHELLLNRWCSGDLIAGEYQVVCRMKTEGGDIEGACKLKIFEPNPGELAEIYEQLANVVLGTGPIPERWDMSEGLRYSCSPHAVGALSRVLKKSSIPDFRWHALDGLCEIGTKEAIQEVANLAGDVSKKSQILRGMARIRIGQIYKTTKNGEVREICRQVLEVDDQQNAVGKE
jgi:hypothetical protein